MREMQLENKLITEEPRTASQRCVLCTEFRAHHMGFLAINNRKCICLFLAANPFIRGKLTDFLRDYAARNNTPNLIMEKLQWRNCYCHLWVEIQSSATRVHQMLPLELDEPVILEALLPNSERGVSAYDCCSLGHRQEKVRKPTF